MTKKNISEFKFKNISLNLSQDARSGGNVSHSSRLLSKILPKEFKGKSILDLGCGSGYMSIGPLVLGASSVLAIDVDDVSTQLQANLKLNNIPENKIKFFKSNLFDSVPPLKDKIDIIIANLPQHSLPATRKAKNLLGKYGGFDGTDIVCRGLTEGANFLKVGGQYYGAVSELTNYERTFALTKCLYNVKIKQTIQKVLRKEEMLPWLSDDELISHLELLKMGGLISYERLNGDITYRVHLVQFTLR
ncbi:MAG: Ribosomal protein L11 methyltransferase [bacterium ADurb.Bin212]|nr:MAG: Ribosomal protein L11 methyltransferase [bacterium ADurb.Bin212]